MSGYKDAGTMTQEATNRHKANVLRNSGTENGRCVSAAIFCLVGGGRAGKAAKLVMLPHHVLTPYAYIYKARELPRHSCFFQGHRLVALPQKGLTAGSANANRLGRRARRSTVRRRGVGGGIGAKRCDQIPSQFHNAGAVRDMRTLIDLQQCVGQ